jgi:hypothetical protein
MVGLVLAVRGRRTVGSWLAARAGEPGTPGPAATRRAGLLTVLGAAVWFLVATRLVIPFFSSGGNFTEALFGDLGSTPTDIARTTLTRPDLVGRHLAESDPLGYVGQLLGSFGYVPVAAPLVLVAGLPQLLINSLAIYDFFWTTKVHYAALPLFATAVSAVEGVARLRGPGLRRAALGAMAVGAFFTAVSWGLSPVSPDYRKGFWPLKAHPAREAQLDRAVALVGPDESVSSVYYLVPHLTHRSASYTFPNPWKASNWGVDGEHLPDPSTVDWLIVDPASLADDERSVLAAVLQDPDRRPGRPQELARRPFTPDPVVTQVNRQRWEVVLDESDLLAVRRIRAGR